MAKHSTDKYIVISSWETTVPLTKDKAADEVATLINEGEDLKNIIVAKVVPVSVPKIPVAIG